MRRLLASALLVGCVEAHEPASVPAVDEEPACVEWTCRPNPDAECEDVVCVQWRMSV